MKNGKGKYWAIGVAGVYISFALATLGFVFFTMTQKVDLVSPDYYEKTLSYEQQIESARRADAFGEAIRCTLDGEKKFVEISFPASLASSNGAITLYRPSGSGLDRNFTLALDARHEQRIPTRGLAKGLWKMKMLWKSGSESYYRECELYL